MNFKIDVPIYTSLMYQLDGKMANNVLKFARQRNVILSTDKDFNSSTIDYFYHSYGSKYHFPYLKLHKNSKIIIDRSFEDGILDDQYTTDLLSYYKSFNIPNENIMLVSNKAKEKMDNSFDYPHLFLDHCAVDVVYRVEKKSHIPNIVLPSMRPKKASYMASKIVDKRERLELIKGMLKILGEHNCNVIATFNENDLKKLQDLESPALIKFLLKNKGPAPGSSVYIMSSGGQAPYTWPCDSAVYTESFLTITSETLPDQPYILLISEKNYRPIINLHPVLCVMHENFKNVMKEIGFNFYESIIGNYEGVPQEIIYAAKKFLNLSQKQLKKVDIIADQNKKTLINYAHQEIESFGLKLNQFLTK